MAAPTCTLASFATALETYNYKKFNAEERKSLMIYFNVIELAAIGGTNYTAQLGPGGTLQDAASCYRNLNNPTCPPSAYRLIIARNNAVSAGGSPAATNDLLAAAIACLGDLAPADRAAQLLFLECSLGRHDNPPA